MGWRASARTSQSADPRRHLNSSRAGQPDFVSTPDLTGQIRFGGIHTMGAHLFPTISQAVAQLAPDLSLATREAEADDLVEMLRQDHIDVALLALPDTASDLEFELIASDPLLLGGAVSHPLVRNSAYVGEVWLTDLKNQQLVLLDDRHCLRGQALAVCDSPEVRTSKLSIRGIVAGLSGRAGLARNAQAVPDMFSLCDALAAGDRITLLPASVVVHELSNYPGLSVRRFAGAAPTRTVAFAWQRSSPRADSFVALAAASRPGIEAVIAAGVTLTDA